MRQKGLGLLDVRAELILSAALTLLVTIYSIYLEFD
jgi:hypothetical protein